MDNTILPSNEVKEFEERLYLNPNLQVEETTSFIDNLRNTQKANNQEIAQQTQALGTNVPSNLGGLTGAGSYFTSRYQTPQTNSTVANLRSVAQAAALNQALSNEQAMWKKRYNEAYRDYQKRAWNKSNTTGGGGSGDPYGYEEGEDPDYESTDKKAASVVPQFSPAGSGTFMFTPDGISTGGLLDINSNPTTPAGKVEIVRNRGGGIESLTYNGKTFTGDAARERFKFLINSGSISRLEE